MKILVFGGTGLLGTHLKKHLKATYLGSKDCDIRDYRSVSRTIRKYRPSLVVNAAAYTDVSGAEKNYFDCWSVNSFGASVIASYSKSLIFISTDYVPAVVNNYAKTKENGEHHSKSAKKWMIIRTSFKPRPYPYQKVPSDMWTSCDYVDVIAPMIANEIKNFRHGETINVGTGRKKLIDLARQTRDDIIAIKRSDIKSVKLPRDVSFK